MAQNDGIYTCLCAFPAQNPVNCDGFGLRTLQSGHTVNASVFMFSAPPIFKSGLKPRYLQVFFVAERAFVASKWHKATVLYTGFCTFLPQNPVYWDGFKLCTLQSGHKTP